MKQAGGTLMETMAVVSIVGLTTLITAEAFLPSTKHNQAQAVRAELAGELRVARLLAMARGRTVRVRLEPGRSRLTVGSVEDEGVVLREFDFSAEGVVVDRVSNGPEILFHGSGRAATPTTVVLRRAYDDKRYPLTVSITGRVTLK